MTTAYTSLLGLALPVTGELSGTWGDTVNNSITSLLDTSVAGTTNVSTDGDVTLTTTTGAANTARQAILLFSGARTALRTVTAPAQSKVYTVINATTGGFSVKLVGSGPTTGVTIVAGESAVCAWNGSDFVKVSNTSGSGTFTNLTVTGNTILGDASADTLTVNATITSNLIFTDNTYDIGASGATRPRSLFLGSNLTVGAETRLFGNVTFENNAGAGQTAKLIQSNAFGAAIRFAANGSSATDRNLQLGYVNNSAVFTSMLDVGAGFVLFNNSAKWGSNFPFTSDNAYDIGASGADRPRTGYFGTSIITGSDSTISGLTVGRGAGAVSTNTAVGASALAANTSGGANVALGQQALLTNITGNDNTALGRRTLYFNTASNNTGVGSEALISNTSGAANTSVGAFALSSNTTASNNTAVGYTAAYSNTTGTNNTAVGKGAMYSGTTAAGNTGVGFHALNAATTGGSNSAFGNYALASHTTGSFNTAVGEAALVSNTTASNNTAVGHQAGYSNTTGTLLTAVGKEAAYSNTTGNYVTAVGYGAAYSNTTGESTTAIGLNALRNNSTGAANTGVAHDALVFNTTGSFNTAMGKEALYANTTASNNTAVGYQAGYSNTTGTVNVFVGQGAGYTNSTGVGNTFVGRNAGYTSNVSAAGGDALNTCIGYSSGYSLTTGTGNNFIGSNYSGTGSGYFVSTGSRNTILGGYNGNQGGLDIRTLSNYIVLSDGDGNPRAYWNGANATFGGTLSVTGLTSTGAIATSNVAAAVTSFSSVCAAGDQTATNLKLTSARTDVFYHIQAFNGSTTECFRVEANGNTKNTNNSYGALSDAKLKENIVDASPKLADLMQVKVRNYNLIGETTKQIGVVAQELETIFPSMVDENADRDEDGNLLETKTKGVKYSVFVPMLIKAMQEQQAIIESLKARLDAANL